MDLRPLGSTGLRVSPLGLGTVKLGRTRGLKHPGPTPVLPTDEQATALLRIAADLGINLIDTAPAYGVSEERLGALMSANNWFSDGGRDHWIISTKAGEDFDNATGLSTFDFSPLAIRQSIDRSLRRLRIDHLDIVLLHCDDRDEWILTQSGAMDALRDLKIAGKVRAIGASTNSVDGGLCAVRRTGAACDVVMLAYNPREREQTPVINAATPRGVGVLIKKVLGSGHIDKISSGLPVDLADLADPAQASLQFSLRHPGVAAVVLGTTNTVHLQAAATAAAT